MLKILTIQNEVQVVSVRQVFKVLILLLFQSCITYNRSIDWQYRTINFNKEVAVKTEQGISVAQKIEINYNRVITKGSISNLTLIGSDLWIGKLGGEILRHNIYTNDTQKILGNIYSIIDFSIKGIVPFKDYIYILQSTRLIEFNTLNEQVRVIDLPEYIQRASSLEIKENILYIGTLGSGIWEYDLYSREYNFISDELLYISSLVLIDSELYIGSMDNGLYIYDLMDDKYKSRLFFPFALFRKNILCMKVIDNTLWIGSAKNGLIIWDMDTNRVERKFEGETISSISHNEGRSAVSIMDEGIVYFENGDEQLFSINNGLKTHNITSLILYENRIISGNIKKGVIDQELQQF